MAVSTREMPRRRFVDAQSGMTVVRILRGEHHVSAAAHEVLSAEVGAAVCLCLRDPKRQMGGMLSLLLPQLFGAEDLEAMAEKYGGYVLERLFGSLERHGCRRTRLEAKLYGGAEINRSDVGAGPRTTSFIERYLEDWGIGMMEEETGGSVVRRVQFFPATGRSRVIPLDDNKGSQVLEVEEGRAPVLFTDPTTGDLEIYD